LGRTRPAPRVTWTWMPCLAI